MKKLLLITILFIGFATTAISQKNNGDVSISTIHRFDTVNLATISQKIDSFITTQEEVTQKLEAKINRANSRLQDLQNQSSLRWLMRDMIPILILLILGGFIVFVIFIITRSIYDNNKLRYDTLLRCTEMTGSVPNLFVTQFNTDGTNKISRRINWQLIFAILSGMVSLFMMLIACFAHGRGVIVAFILCFISALISSLLFIQIYQRSNRENTGANQQ